MSDQQHDAKASVERLLSLARELGDRFPKILLVVSAYRGLEPLKDTLTRIHPEVIPLIHEITVFDVFSESDAHQTFEKLSSVPGGEKLRYVRIPRRYEYGENLKNCFDYAIEKGLDYVVILRGDGSYDPACLPSFLMCALIDKCSVVIGDRMGGDSEWPRWLRSLRLTGNRALSLVEEFVLSMGLRDYHCGYRMISTDVLKRIPYSLNAGDYLFDLQLLIQIRCLGIRICTVPVPEFHDLDLRAGKLIGYALRALQVAVEYRMHQLHLVRRDIYFVDLGEYYTLKRNRYSSHMQILDSLEPGSKVLDIGCGQSLLASEYANRGITVVGVDHIAEDKVSPFVHHYVRHDLETTLNLPYGRDFDYIILSDVIEHINNRDALMSSLRRYLKGTGKLIASTGNIAIWFYRVSLFLGRFEYGPRGILDRTHVHLFTLDSFKRFLRQKGYRLLDVRFTPIPFELVFSSTGRSSLVEAITRWYYRLSVLWPRLFAYQFIVYGTFRSYESALGEETWQPSDQGLSGERSLETGPQGGRDSDREGTTPRYGGTPRSPDTAPASED